MQTNETYKDLNRRFYDRLNQADFTVLDEMLSDNFYDHAAPPGIPNDRSGVKQYFQMIHTAFPDMRFTIEDMIMEDDRIMTASRFTGTNTGSFMGMPPTGKQVEIQSMDIVRIDRKTLKAVEHWGIMDMLTMMQQMGLAQATGAQ